MALGAQTPLNPVQGLTGQTATGSAATHAHTWVQGLPIRDGQIVSFIWQCSCGREVISKTTPSATAAPTTV